MHWTDVTGLAGIAFALAALIVPRAAAGVSGRTLLLSVCSGMVLVLLPFGSLSVAGYVRGVSGDLSTATLLLLALALQRRVAGNNREATGRTGLLIEIALAALVLYPMALGLGPWDPYRLGYGHPGFLAALLVITLLAALRRQPLIALHVGIAVLAWAVGWHESHNLWDYVIDPWVSAYALGVLLKRGVLSMWRRRHASG